MADFTLDNLKNVSVPEENKENVEEYLKKMQTHYDAREAPNKSYRWQMSDFEVGCPLGTGKFGHVYLAKEKTTQIMIALKVLYKVEIINERMTHQVMPLFVRNSALRNLVARRIYPFILVIVVVVFVIYVQVEQFIQLYEHIKNDKYLIGRTLVNYNSAKNRPGASASRGTQTSIRNEINLIEMFTHMRKQPHQRYTEKDAAKYIYQVADAIHYCHQKKVIHRDIKPENLLLTMHEDVKISDFGWSVHAPSLHRKTMCGTLDYLPPEMVTSQHYGKEVDNWCIGILAYEFLVGKPPFESKDQDTTLERIFWF
ncbi:aurora kinase C-like [Diaphorina citri]|uniref:Aurora kinase C-like n=1 Tax=Diaphorina citri TaxID=121845 RepID=A0A1S3DD46_DIACI|nr:aurora kinase C-like [Diaphorina citri]